MSADPIVYCLERLTDYRQFERLATDLMARIGYPNIEPIGGTQDGGRDAIFYDEADEALTVFAYSVRVDWEAKLQHDCRRISRLEISPNRVAFVSTQEISARKKDKHRAAVARDYGWKLDFYDIERIRALLRGSQQELLDHHPSIFVAPWFERRGGQLITHQQRDLVIIDHLPSDHACATWLFRKLSALGYSVWCHGLAPLAGENADDSVRALISRRVARYLPLLSSAARRDANLMARVAQATAEENRTLPCWLSEHDADAFAVPLQRLTPARFDGGWSKGLRQVVLQLENSGVARPMESSLGQRIALRAYMTEPLLQAEAESVYANEFPVTLPTAILAYELKDRYAKLPSSLHQNWAYERRGDWLLSFAPPPSSLRLIHLKPGKYSWRDNSRNYGINSNHLIKILLKRSLALACYRTGFQLCSERDVFFLDEEKPIRHRYQHVDGRHTLGTLTGVRSWRSGLETNKFRYQLGPLFRVRIDEGGAVWVLLRLYVRLTDLDGLPLPRTMIPSRRKRVTRSWWNKQWLHRMLGMMQFIAGDGSGIDGEIVIGSSPYAVTIKVRPRTFECPVGIDVAALDRVGNFQAEMSALRFSEDELQRESND